MNGPESGGMTPADLEVAEGIRLEYQRKQRFCANCGVRLRE